VQEKNQESGGGDMQRKLNWFDLICIGIGELLAASCYSSLMPLVCEPVPMLTGVSPLLAQASS
jgi:hypothetical protein